MSGAGVTVAWEAGADVVVVGSGVAGLTTAINAAAGGLSVLVVTKGAPDESNTSWAQGGVAVVRAERDPGDSVSAHIKDTLVAGAGLCDPAAVAQILTDGDAAFARLLVSGALFDAGPQGLQRTREGGHSANRVVHAGGDATGAEIERILLARAGRPAMLADHQALDVVLDSDGRAAGVTVLDLDGRIGVVRARAVVLATGGAGHLYAATTNPDVATADGLAMGLRAGAQLADVEFMQFHPTVLWTGPGERGHRPLVTEAVRGEGAVLVDATGARIMTGVHPLADLAPRDVVSLAITRRLAQIPGGVGDHVFLDATGIAPDRFGMRFPTVSAACARAGIKPSVDLIPVAPAAHYHCGGVVTDLQARTNVPGLYAVGEVARTGLHGANRLASNSLLEGLVMGERAAEAIGQRLAALVDPVRDLVLPEPSTSDPVGRLGLQSQMSVHAGVGRDQAGMQLAMAATTTRPAALTRDSVETANLAQTSAALLTAASTRTESRGCHVRTDWAVADPEWASSVVMRLVDGRLQTEVVELSADRRLGQQIEAPV